MEIGGPLLIFIIISFLLSPVFLWAVFIILKIRKNTKKSVLIIIASLATVVSVCAAVYAVYILSNICGDLKISSRIERSNTAFVRQYITF